MKKALLSLLLAFVCLLIVGCGEKEPVTEEPPVPYEGTYKLRSVQYGGVTLNLGEGGLLGMLTEDLAVLTIEGEGKFTFKSDIIVIQFDIAGEWKAEENDASKVTFTIHGEEGDAATLNGTCDGETVVLEYKALFTLNKVS